MKKGDFNRLINIIKMRSQNKFYEVLPLTFGKGVNTFTTKQWLKLGQTIAEIGNITRFECSFEKADFSHDTWVALLNMLKANKIDDLSIRNFPIHLYDEAKCDWLFSQMETIPIRKFKLSLISVEEDGSLDYFMLKVGNSSFEEFGLRGTDFYEVSKTSLDHLFRSLSRCVCMKRLLLGCSFNLFEDTEFWRSFEANFPKHIEHIELNGTHIFELPSDVWLAICERFRDSSMRSLSLQTNQPYRASAEQWTSFFTGIRRAQTSILDLREHSPRELDNWDSFYIGLSESFVTTLLYENQQFNNTQQELIEIALEQNKLKLTLANSQVREDALVVPGEDQERMLEQKENIFLRTIGKVIKVQRDHQAGSEDGRNTNPLRDSSTNKPNYKA